MAEIIRSNKSRVYKLPVYGAGADLARGTVLIPGVTAETDDGVLINSTATSMVDALGVLVQLHDFSASGDALVTGAVPWFRIDTANSRTETPTREVELLDAGCLLLMDYDTSDTMTGSSSSTTVTVASLEDNIDTGFIYGVSGTGAGQLGFIDTSASGSCTLDAAPTVAYSSTPLLKILPLFHTLLKVAIATATAPTKIGTDAAAGSARALIVQRYITVNGLREEMDPVDHDARTGLNSAAQLSFQAVVRIQDSAFDPID